MPKKIALWLCLACLAKAQAFVVTATPIPTKLANLNYGKLPRGIAALDIDICNTSTAKADLTSSRVYQALIQADAQIQPIGQNIMMAAILKNQNNSVKTWLGIGLSSTTGVLSVLGTSKAVHIGSGWTNGLALGALLGSVILTNLSPELTANQVQNFQAQVLPQAMILDSGTCIERTVFTATAKKAPPLTKNLAMRIN